MRRWHKLRGFRAEIMVLMNGISTGSPPKLPAKVEPPIPKLQEITPLIEKPKGPARKLAIVARKKPNRKNEREIMRKAKDFDFKKVYEMLQEAPNRTEVLSKIYLEQRYYGKVLEISNEKMQRIECYTRMGYLDRALSDLETKEEFTTALAGFTRIKSKRLEMELLWDKIKKVHTPDLFLYNTIMRGYLMHQEYDKVLELYMEMLINFQPDHHTYSIISMCYLQSQDSRFLEITDKYKHLESDISRSYEIIYKTRSGQYEFNEIVDQFTQRPSLFHRAELVSSLLAALIKRSSPNVHRFVDYLMENKVAPSARLYSLLILLCGRTFNAAYDAWPLYDQMKQKQIPPNEKVFTNLLGIGVKTNSVKNLYSLMNDITQTLHPRSFYRDCLELFGCVRPGCVDYEEQSRRNLLRISSADPTANDNLYEPYVQDFPRGIKPKKKKNIDSGQQHYTNLAIILMTDMLKRKVIPQSSHFYSILENSLIPTSKVSNLAVSKLYDLLLKIRESSPADDFEPKFWEIVLESSRWDIVQDLAPSAPQLDRILTIAIIDYGKKEIYLWLYTLAMNMKLSKDMTCLILENLGINCRRIEYLDAIYNRIKPQELSEPVVWAYIRSLIWLGHHQRAVKVATTEYNPDFGGMIVKELRKWLHSHFLHDLEKELVGYWHKTKPEWVPPSIQ